MSGGESLKTLKARVEDSFRDDFLRKAVKYTADRLRGKKQESTALLGHWEEWREAAWRIREHTIAHLDAYLERFAANAERQGTRIHFAADASEAVSIFLDLVRRKNARLVAKSKSMVSEEIYLNRHLEQAGVECVETDLGEWIIQLAGEMPSHLIIPAIHKNRKQIRALFERKGDCALTEETSVLAGFARKTLREVFQKADIGMTGCNFAIAETGSVVLFTNEGNGRMVSTLPETHIVMMGMERILPSWKDFLVMARVLPRSATGQKITTYISGMTGPAREGETDGPRETHVIILDNGRSALLGDPEFREILHCIRCGACLNACPVYRQIDGHAYRSVYSGPIGAVLTPLLHPGERSELVYASSLCGACAEACPVKIPLHDMLVHLRRKNVEAGAVPWPERMGFRMYAALFESPGRYRAAGRMARSVQRLIFPGEKQTLATVLPGVKEWAKCRVLPPAGRKAFRDLWREEQGSK